MLRARSASALPLARARVWRATCLCMRSLSSQPPSPAALAAAPCLGAPQTGNCSLSWLLTWKGTDATLKPILFHAHIDVVPTDPDKYSAVSRFGVQGLLSKTHNLKPDRVLLEWPAARGSSGWSAGRGSSGRPGACHPVQ